jgi:hypothetical protein
MSIGHTVINGDVMRKVMLLGMLLLIFSNMTRASESFINFDFIDGEIENGFDDWVYTDRSESHCGVYNGTQQSTLCRADGVNMYAYYNNYNNNHMGWLRYGFIDSSSDVSVSGSSLKVQTMGGAYGDEYGGVSYVGYPIKSKSMYAGEIADPSVDTLPGDLSLYFKTANSTQPFADITQSNRISVWVKMPDSYQGMETNTKFNFGAPRYSFSLYPFIDTSKGGHYYHGVSNVAMGGWTKLQFDAHPTHHNAGSNGINTSLPEGGYAYPGDGKAYFANMTTFALRESVSQNGPVNTAYYVDEMRLAYVPYENEETISNVGVGYDPHSQVFDIAFSDKYRCGDCSANYAVRYAFSPITNATFDSAFIPQETINFNRSQSNAGGQILKPNNGYNQIWAALVLQDVHKKQIKEDATIYFAIKDLSERLFQQDPIDFEQVNVPGLGLIEKQRLIKTIDYQIVSVDNPIVMSSSALPIAEKGVYYDGSVDFTGGTAPFDIVMSGDVPDGLVIGDDKRIRGVPRIAAQYTFDVIITDALGQQVSTPYNLDVQNEINYDEQYCGVLVDFKDSKSSSLIEDPRFHTVFTDAYTGFTELGSTIVAGNNGDYDYQGISGDSYTLYAGDQVRLSWVNTSNATITFAPRLSFSIAGRYSDADINDWLILEAQSVKAGAISVFTYTLTETMSSTSLNVNVNHAQRGKLVLDKIESIEAMRDADEWCREAKSGAPVARVLVDFNQSDEESSLDVAGLQTIIRDVYTRFVETDGVSAFIRNASGYNYQGVKGSGFALQRGDEIHVTLRNTANEEYNFIPKVSFTDPDRMGSGIEGEWLSMSPVSLGSLATRKAIYVVTDMDAAVVKVINISQDHRDAYQVVVDKIELLTQSDVLGIATQELTPAIRGQDYTASLDYAGTRRSVHFSTSSTLPSGISLDANGVFSGEPNEIGQFPLLISLYSEDGSYTEKTIVLTVESADSLNALNCQRIVDFSPQQSMQASSVSQIIKDSYTGLHNTGMTTVLGSNEDYNYQGVRGSFDNVDGGKVRAVWFNSSSESVTFTPRISFLSDVRYTGRAPEGTWSDMDQITVLPGARGVSQIDIEKPSLSVINVNSNARGNRIMLLERIQHVNAMYGDGSICEMNP